MANYKYPSWINADHILKRSWDKVAVNSQSSLCSVKAIAIHYTEVPGQKATDTIKAIASMHTKATEEITSPWVGAHFVIDETGIYATAPDPLKIFYHAGAPIGTKYYQANPQAWNLDAKRWPRGNANFYTIGIEHCHKNASGFFTAPVLKNSHKLVNWLLDTYGNLTIGRHFDFTGKPCPLWFAPVLNENRGTDSKGYAPYYRVDLNRYKAPFLELDTKRLRWEALLRYYKQSNPDEIAAPLNTDPDAAEAHWPDVEG